MEVARRPDGMEKQKIKERKIRCLVLSTCVSIVRHGVILVRAFTL